MDYHDLMASIKTRYTQEPRWIGSDEPQDAYLKYIELDIRGIVDDDEDNDDEFQSIPLAHITGSCLIGSNSNFVTLDDHSQDYCNLGEALMEVDMLEDYRDIFIIDDIQMSDGCIRTEWLQTVLENIANILDITFNFSPELVAYLVPTNPKYIEHIELADGMSEESVDKWSPFILSDNGFSTTPNGKVLYRVY